MLDFMNGMKNFLTFINDNWAMITTIIGLALVVYKKIRSYMQLSRSEKIEIAKSQIKEIILRLVTEAEIDYDKLEKAGEIKRAQVIDEIFTMYPVLSEIADQESLIEWIDTAIDEALKKMRKIFEENKENATCSEDGV